MSEDVVVPQRRVERKLSPAEQAIASAREKLSRYLPRAVEILTELAETSENDRVRLAAAESIADRAGLGKSSTTHVQVNTGEHEALELEAQEMYARMGRNKAAITEGTLDLSLEALVVHEGEPASSS